MANYGNTPAFVKNIRFGACRLDQLPDVPTYPETSECPDMYFPFTGDVRGLRNCVNTGLVGAVWRHAATLSRSAAAIAMVCALSSWERPGWPP